MISNRHWKTLFPVLVLCTPACVGAPDERSPPSAPDPKSKLSAEADDLRCGNDLRPWPLWWPWSRSFVSLDVPVRIPDNNATGVRSMIDVPPGFDFTHVAVDVDISHTFRSDLVIQLISPSGQVATLSDREGGSEDDFVVTALDVSGSFQLGPQPLPWQLFVRDLAALDVGTINRFCLTFGSATGQ
jgi:hypothetical protein